MLTPLTPPIPVPVLHGAQPAFLLDLLQDLLMQRSLFLG